jgi:hypothetical protein
MVSDMAFMPNLGDLNTYRTVATANGAALTSGVMTSVSFKAKAGQKITSISVVSATTAAGTPTHWWLALYSAAATPALVAQTADQTTTALGANTLVTKNLAAPVTMAVAGTYWIGINFTATTVPTLLSAPTLVAGLLNGVGVLAGDKALAVTSGTGLLGVAPPTIATPATSLVVPLVFIS